MSDLNYSVSVFGEVVLRISNLESQIEDIRKNCMESESTDNRIVERKKKIEELQSILELKATLQNLDMIA